jgi:hypothetical protein
MEKDVETRKSRKGLRRELSRSIEKKEHRGRTSARAKDHVASEKTRKRSRSRSRRAKDPVPSRKRRELSPPRNQRDKDQSRSRKRRELSRNRLIDRLSRSRSRRSKGRLTRSDKKEKKPTIESNFPRLPREREGSWRDARGHSERHHQEETSARAEDHELPHLSPLGVNMLDILMCQVSRAECFTICEYIVDHKQGTQAPSFGGRSIFHTRPRTPVKEVRPSSTARASDYHKKSTTYAVEELSSESDYSSAELEDDRGENCKKTEMAESAACGASAKAGAAIKPVRAREQLKQIEKKREELRKHLLAAAPGNR